MHFCVVRRENVLFCDGVNPKEGFGVASAMQAPVGLATERAVPALLAGGHCFGRQAAGAWRSHKRRTPFSCTAIAQRKKKVQTRALRGSAQSFIGKKPYLNLRLRAASDFFLRLTDGFS